MQDIDLKDLFNEREDTRINELLRKKGFPIPEPLTSRRDDIIRHIYSRCRVEDHGYDTPCYIYEGSTSGTGHRGHSYPKVSIDSQMVRAHRAIFICFEGYLHSKRQVDHRCGQRMCVRYEHLRKATQKQNCLFRDQKNGVVRRKRRRRKIRK
ncbi:MAG TPA: HNH endonuclease [Anaerolineales bacterium]